MRDIPLFTTEFGTASLILGEIPYRKECYIRILDSLEPEKLVAECVKFCRMCGAEYVFAAGHSYLKQYNLHCAILQMQGHAEPDPEHVRSLFPVTEKTAARFREIYNQRMAGVMNAKTMTIRDEEKLSCSQAYFIHERNKLLGIGLMDRKTICAIAAAASGCGAYCLHSIFSLCPGEMLSLQVASTNAPAIRLYESNGFLITREISKWYRVFP